MSSRPALALVAAGLLCAADCDGDTGDGDTLGRFTLRLSVSRTGAQALGDSQLAIFALGSSGSNVSADGRYVVFESRSSNLTDDDPNTVQDIFVKDRLTGAVERVSVNTTGPVDPTLAGAVADSSQPSISPDGRYVVFVSPGNMAGFWSFPTVRPQVYLHDRATRTTRTIMSATIDDAEGPVVAVDPNGRVLVAFVTNDDDPAYTYPTPDIRQVWVSHVNAGPTPLLTLVSRLDTDAGDGESRRPRFSADGTLLVFDSAAANLNPDDTSSQIDVYAVSPDGGPPGGAASDPPELVSRRDDDDAPIGGFDDHRNPWPSADGRYVVFATAGDIGTGLGSFGATQVVRRDRLLGATSLISRTLAGVPGDNGSGFPSCSDDGETVAFTTTAPNLLGTPGLSAQIAVRLPDGTVVPASVGPDGTFSEFLNRPPVVSGDGRWVVWHTASSDLVLNDTNGSSDVFTHGPLR